MKKVFKNIFVGDMHDALNRESLEMHNIESIFSFEFVSVPGFVKAKCFVQVSENQPIDGPWLGDAFCFLRAQTAMGRNILVHCQDGISKSPSLVAGYLCFTYGIPINVAISLIKSKRPEISPTPQFLYSLDDFIKKEYNRVMGA